MKSLLLVILFLQVLLVANPPSYEASIRSLIFKNISYEKTLRPNLTTKIFLKLQFKQLVSVNEKAQSTI